MNATDAAVQEIEVLREHERAIGRLYVAYAHRFPQDRDFWLNLSDEEDQHARWLRSLQTKMEEQTISRIINRFPAVAINHSIDYINKLIDTADRPDLTPIKALSAALDIERALLENKWFEVFETDSAEVRRVLTALAQGTKAHIDKVQHTWRDRKPGPDVIAHT
jgi:rubrerythrin